MATTCDNCSTECGADDLFCEKCGYDFITGSLPDGGLNPSDADSNPSDTATTETNDVDVADASSAWDGDDGAAPVAAAPVEAASDADARVEVLVAVDRAYFDSVVTGGELAFPDDAVAEQKLELYGRELHIGRTSESRDVHPQIDIERLTDDPAASTRHAVLRIANDATYTITDLGSTNGTFVNSFDDDPITQGVPVPLIAGTSVFVGAWTRLTIVE